MNKAIKSMPVRPMPPRDASAECLVPVKSTASSDMLRAASMLAERAEVLASAMGERLSPITSTDPYPDIDATDMFGGRALPPLFGVLRDHFNRIDMALTRCTDTLDRCEI